MKQCSYDYRPLLLSNESQFWIGNPSVELSNGKMYFQNQPSLLVVCLSIPNSQQPIEFCEFLNDYIKDISEMKVLMIESPQTYAILMKFIKIESAKAFIETKHKTLFNQIEEDICIVRNVQKITMDSDKEQSIFYQKGKQKVQPKKLHSKKNTNYDSDQCAICFEHLSQKTLPISPEKLPKSQKSKTDAIISVLCGHYFHLRCLWQWNQPVCPLCRYEQQPPEVSFCDLCSNSESLWLCLICGQKFCEEQEINQHNSHNQEHYIQTQHALFMNINTKLVFDQQSLNYVHRILINQFDGKLVPLQEGKLGTKDYDSKLTEYLEEQNQIFTQSLASQRIYFEQLLSKQKAQRHLHNQSLINQLHNLELTLDNMIKDSKSQQDTFTLEESSLANLKIQFLETNSRKLLVDKINANLIEQIQKLEAQSQLASLEDFEKLKQIKAEVLSVQLDIRDLEQNLKFKQKIQQDGLSQEDMQTSKIILQGNQYNNNKKKKK